MSDIEVERIGEGCTTVWLNAAHRRNALDGAMMRALTAAVDQAARDDDCRVIVLRGRGGTFCAGRALAKDGAPQTPDAIRHRLGEARALAEAVLDCAKPIVAAVEGYAVGVGLSLALWCDYVVASCSALFLAPEVRHGFPPTMTAVTLLRRLPRGVAMELLMSGRHLSADEAIGLGLVGKVVAPDGMDALVAALGETYGVIDPAALAGTKAIARLTGAMPLAAALSEAAEFSFAWETGTPDAWLSHAGDRWKNLSKESS